MHCRNCVELCQLLCRSVSSRVVQVHLPATYSHCCSVTHAATHTATTFGSPQPLLCTICACHSAVLNPCSVQSVHVIRQSSTLALYSLTAVRRVYNAGVRLALYTGGQELPNVITRVRYDCQPLRPPLFHPAPTPNPNGMTVSHNRGREAAYLTSHPLDAFI